jgi:hypothetical protein
VTLRGGAGRAAGGRQLPSIEVNEVGQLCADVLCLRDAQRGAAS